MPAKTKTIISIALTTLCLSACDNTIKLATLDCDKLTTKTEISKCKAEKQKVPYMLVIGDREVAEEKVAVRARQAGDLGAVTIDEFMNRFEKEQRDLKS